MVSTTLIVWSLKKFSKITGMSFLSAKLGFDLHNYGIFL